jgi:hypothetical protein
VLSQDAFPNGSQSLDRLLGTDVENVGVPDHPGRTEGVERVAEHQQLRLGVVSGTPPGPAQPGVADGEGTQARIDVVEARGADEPSAALLQLRVGQPLPSSTGGERRQHLRPGLCEVGGRLHREPPEHLLAARCAMCGVVVSRSILEQQRPQPDQSPGEFLQGVPAVRVGGRRSGTGGYLDFGSGHLMNPLRRSVCGRVDKVSECV